MKYRLLCTLLLYSLVRASIDNYRFEDLTPISPECWRGVVIESYISKCFFSVNQTNDENLSPSLFFNQSVVYPGVFDPLNLIKDVFALHDDILLGNNNITLSNGTTLSFYGVDLKQASSNIAEENAPYVEHYRLFCSARTFMYPIQECIAYEVRSAPTRGFTMCTTDEKEGIVEAMELSQVHYDFHKNTCDKVFHCSPNPLAECIEETGFDYSQGFTSLSSVCVVLPHLEETLMPCVEKKTQECPAETHEAYQAFMRQVSDNWRLFVYNTSDDPLKYACSRTMSCDAEQQANATYLINECFGDLYQLREEIPGQIIHSVDPVYTLNSKQLNSTEESSSLDQDYKVCLSLISAQDCVNEVNTLCDSVKELVAIVTGKLENQCILKYDDIAMMRSTTTVSTPSTTVIKTERETTATTPSTTKEAAISETTAVVDYLGNAAPVTSANIAMSFLFNLVLAVIM